MPKNTDGLQNGKKFPKGTSGNPAGRPPKLLNATLENLKSKGYTAVSKAEIKDLIATCMQLDEIQLRELITDKTQPIIVRTVATMIGHSSSDLNIFKTIIETAHGKENHKIDLTTNGESLNAPILRPITKDEIGEVPETEYEGIQKFPTITD